MRIAKSCFQCHSELFRPGLFALTKKSRSWNFPSSPGAYVDHKVLRQEIQVRQEFPAPGTGVRGGPGAEDHRPVRLATSLFAHARGHGTERWTECTRITIIAQLHPRQSLLCRLSLMCSTALRTIVVTRADSSPLESTQVEIRHEAS